MSPQANVRGKSYPGILGRLLRFLITVGLGMTIGILVLTYYTADSLYDFSDSVRYADRDLKPVDAIVVLAGGKGRIRAAGDIWERYYDQYRASQPVQKKSRSKNKKQAASRELPPQTPVIYVSGMGPQADDAVFLSQLRGSLKDRIDQLKIPLKNFVILENQSANTIENARYLLQHAQTKRWKSILLVTSSYHMKRSKMIFQKITQETGYRLTLQTLSYEVKPYAKGYWRQDWDAIRVTLLEYLKWVFYRYLEKDFA